MLLLFLKCVLLNEIQPTRVTIHKTIHTNKNSHIFDLRQSHSPDKCKTAVVTHIRVIAHTIVGYTKAICYILEL